MPDRISADLVESGLSEQEAKTYLALLDHYKLSAKELSRLTGIFRTQMYDVLKSLISKGFCTEVLDRVKTYVPVDPNLALQSAIIDFESKQKIAQNLASQLHQRFLSNEKNQHAMGKMIEVLRSDSVVRKRLRSYLKLTKQVILSFNKPPYQLRMNGDNGDMITCQDHKQKGITHRAIFQIDSKNPEYSLAVAKKFASLGEAVRLTRFLPMKMMIFDNTRVFYQLKADDAFSESDTATFIHHPEITLALINSFWVEWNQSLSIAEFEQELKKNE